jgi:hypothetical protein
MFRFAFRNLSSLFEFQAAFFTVAPKQPSYLCGMCGKIRQGLVHRACQRGKRLAVLGVRRPLFGLLPQVCNRMVIRRIRGQRMGCEAITMGQHKRWRRGAGVITGASMDHQEMRLGLIKHPLHEALVPFRGKPALAALIKEMPGEILKGAEDFVACALATGRPCRLVATACPGLTQRAPRGKAGLLFTQA